MDPSIPRTTETGGPWPESHDPWSDRDEPTVDEADHSAVAPALDRPARPSLVQAGLDSGGGWVPLLIPLAAAGYRVIAGLFRHEGPTLTVLGLSAAIWIALCFAGGELVHRFTDADAS